MVIDAIEAARAVVSGRVSGTAKSADGNVEAIRALLIAKRSGRGVSASLCKWRGLMVAAG